MLKKILAVIAGLFAGGIAIFIVESIGHYLFPLPEVMKSDDVEAMKNYVSAAPFMALLFVIMAYAAGAFTSGFVSTKVSGDGSKLYAGICGVIFLFQSLYMMYTLPTPLWFWILGILVWGLVFLGWKIAANNKFKK